ncbi:MAG: thioredoxin domain-containing protein [Acidobacteriaceae bacterium]|nr:thioredoxin domain-containing protein [Acidobacteriaceae bacterium]MBV9308473.1 thioredoxin domain-containing protein [Acidobacteriaceae bacterium]
MAISLAPLFFSVLAFSASADNKTVTTETIIADVNGTKITYGEFEAKKSQNLLQARNAFYSQERQVLDDYINDYLLKQQAQKEGVTVEQLLDRHVRSTLPKDPSDEALQVYYEGINAQEPFESLRGKILDHIRQLRFDKAKAAYLQTLRSKAKIAVSLPPPRAEIAMTNTPVLGDPNASVMFVEYADYECPVCQQTEPTVAKLKTEYKGKVAFAFKEMPLPMHPHAEKASEAARCAGAQGKYWEFHDQLFASKKLTVPDLKADAQKLNLDTAAFNQCLDSGSEAGVVKTQLTEGENLGIPGTPHFFINGRSMGNAPYEQLRAAIEEELTAASGNQPKQTASR